MRAAGKLGEGGRKAAVGSGSTLLAALLLACSGIRCRAADASGPEDLRAGAAERFEGLERAAPPLGAESAQASFQAPAAEQRRRTAVPFLLGVNYPWYNYGSDFGDNAWKLGGVSDPRNRAAIEKDFAFLKSNGAQVVRWFVFCDGRTSPAFDQAGYVTGLSDRFYADFDAALEIARLNGLKLLPVLFGPDLTFPGKLEGGVQVGGRRELVTDPAKRKTLLDNALAPLFRRYGRRPEIAAWEVMNEPELAAGGLGSPPPGGQVSLGDLQAFVGDVAALVHAAATQPVTVGGWRRSLLQYWRESGLDFYEFHYYDADESTDPLGVPYAELGLDKPCIVGEFPSKTTRRSMKRFLDTIWDNGYSGAMPWSLRATDPYSDFAGRAGEFAAWARRHATSPEIGPRR